MLVLLIGPLFALVSCTASLNGVTYDYEHSYGNPSADVQGANKASLQEALIIAASVMLLAVHVWRAVEPRNAEVEVEAVAAQTPDTQDLSPAKEEERRPGEATSYKLKRRNRIVM